MSNDDIDPDIDLINITAQDLAAGKALAVLLGTLTDSPADAAKVLAYAALAFCDGIDEIAMPEGPSPSERADMKQTIVSVVLAVVSQSKHAEGNGMARLIREAIEAPTGKPN